MTKVLVTAYPSSLDVVQLEPTLEALYYKYENCELSLRTLEAYFPFFEHHPLITGLVSSKDETVVEEDYAVIVDIPDMETFSVPLPIVDKIAGIANVILLRKTPKIFLDAYPEDSDNVVLCKVQHKLKEWPEFTDSLHPHYLTEEISTPEDSEDLRRSLRVLASATLVVGPESWATHAAAALDARVIMAMDFANESIRAPFNTIVTSTDKESILDAVEETLFERRYPKFLNCGNAAEFIKCQAKKYLKSNFVDVGCSAWPIPNGIPIDTGNREIIEKAPDNHYSGVFSSHCLEHVTEWEQELILWHRITRKDGVMFLYLPHPRAEVWRAFTGSWVKSNHVWNPEPVTLVRFLKEVLGMHIIEYTSRRDPLWSFHIVARKI
jgi:hypothetical protein